MELQSKAKAKARQARGSGRVGSDERVRPRKRRLGACEGLALPLAPAENGIRASPR
jgi:hypothetical protein